MPKFSALAWHARLNDHVLAKNNDKGEIKKAKEKKEGSRFQCVAMIAILSTGSVQSRENVGKAHFKDNVICTIMDYLH